MPSFVILSAGRTGEATDAILCDPNPVTGQPDRRSDTPVSVRLVSEKTLTVDGEPRGIISAVGINGSTTFLINGSKGLLNRERRAALAQASSLLQQCASTLKPLQAGSKASGLATEALGMLFDCIRDEYECATTAPRPETTSSPAAMGHEKSLAG